MPLPSFTPGVMLQTVLSALSDAQKNLQYKNAFIERIYWNYQPVVATPFSTLNVPIPSVNENNVVNIASGPLQPAASPFTSIPITLDHNQSNSYVVYGFDQARIAYDLRTFFFGPKLEELMRSINRTIVALFTAANFPTYALFTGTGTVSGQITRADLTKAWANLAGAGVPVDDYANVSLMLQTASYGQMLADANFINQYVVGEGAAVDAQQRAQLRTLYGAEVYYDQMMAPINAPKALAVLMHRYAVAGVTANPPPAGVAGVVETTRNVFGLPVHIQLGYDLMNQGWIVHMHVLYGIAVARPEMATLFQAGV